MISFLIPLLVGLSYNPLMFISVLFLVDYTGSFIERVHFKITKFNVLNSKNMQVHEHSRENETILIGQLTLRDVIQIARRSKLPAVLGISKF